MIAFTTTLDGNVVDVALDGLSGELGENLVHCPLIGSTGVLQPKGHDCVAENPKRCPEGGVLLVIRVHFDLIVLGEAIHEGHPLIAAVLSTMISVTGNGNSSFEHALLRFRK